jgi:thiamine biosynthesis lipoprotein
MRGVSTSAKSVLLFILFTVLGSCARGVPAPIELVGTTMGTTWSVIFVHEGDPDPDAVRRVVQKQLDLVDRLMSHYRAESEVSAFNRLESPTPFPLSRETAAVVSTALEISELSGGALDITIGPLVDAWGFGPGGRTVDAPTEDDLATLLETTGSRHLTFDVSASTLSKHRRAVRIDLSSIAKGHAVDLVADALVSEGVGRFMVEVGGELRVHGRNPDGAPWRIAIEQPTRGGRAVHSVVAVTGGALATSGDYRSYRSLGESTMSHIIDPRTGRPVTHALASVSVIDERCVRADAWATALLVLGPEDGPALAERLGLAALFITRSPTGAFEERATTTFQPLLADK